MFFCNRVLRFSSPSTLPLTQYNHLCIDPDSHLFYTKMCQSCSISIAARAYAHLKWRVYIDDIGYLN